MHEIPAAPDISESMGIEDYTLDRPNRAAQAPSPYLYRQGWEFAVAEDERRRAAQENGDQ